ncbi:hypothetical protein LH47_02828 [Anoxybacillus thermarum]|uniref:Uncharacterized protein n=1 Tax=Anoxybacillus thermarum TaxID=404937 RepID=A0A0D0RUJ6_9BACL|nr:hypothetical protein [Anoxybacillus thermarum]KIQ93120.1 hypothetical protein LH47_02828 [Anoxybacillus thermarum]
MKKGLLAFSLAALLGTSFIAGNQTEAASVTGPGGTSRIDYLRGSDEIYWSVKPNTSWPYQFLGYVTFGYGASGSVPVASAGVGLEDGLVDARGSGYCSATLSGTAYALDGDTFTVLPGVTTYYTR